MRSRTPKQLAHSATAVYRLYAEDGSLLYVGISNDPARRFQSHKGVQPWWGEVAEKTIAWYPNRLAALKAGHEAIGAEGPRYNIQWRAYTSARPVRAIRTPKEKPTLVLGGTGAHRSDQPRGPREFRSVQQMVRDGYGHMIGGYVEFRRPSRR